MHHGIFHLISKNKNIESRKIQNAIETAWICFRQNVSRRLSSGVYRQSEREENRLRHFPLIGNVCKPLGNGPATLSYRFDCNIFSHIFMCICVRIYIRMCCVYYIFLIILCIYETCVRIGTFVYVREFFLRVNIHIYIFFLYESLFMSVDFHLMHK